MKCNIKIGATLIRLRKAKLLSQKELAHLCNLNVRYISDLERNVYYPGFIALCKLAYALNMKPSELMLELEESTSLLSDVTKS